MCRLTQITTTALQKVYKEKLHHMGLHHVPRVAAGNLVVGA